MRRAPDFRQHGVTLIEMIVVIVVSGILLGMAAMFGRWQIQSYLDISSRAALADAGDTALRRIARELQAALPNSVRVTASGANALLEFVPIRDAGRYRAESGGGVGDAPLDLSCSSGCSFDIFGPPVTIGNGESIVIYNLGVTGADVYEGTSRRAAMAGASLSKVTAQADTQFLFASPQKRFHIVSTPVTFECVPNAADPDQGVIRRRWGYAYSPSQPTSFAGSSSGILVSGVTACSMTYVPGVLQRNGLAAIRLTLTNADGSERIELLHQVEVFNAP